MTADLDLKFQNAIADDLPSFLVNPSGGLEAATRSPTPLASVRGGDTRRRRAGRRRPRRASTLPDYGAAPDFVDTAAVVQHADGEPLSIAELTGEGRVVLIDFWTYTCINCIRTLPYVESWDAEYREDGLTVVGVHSPEFAFEKDAGNVADAIDRRRDRLPGRPGQRPRHLERVRQPVLAGQVPDRRRRPRPLRRTSARASYDETEAGDPLAARRGGRPGGSAATAKPERRSSAPTRRCARPRPTSAPPAPRAGSTGRSPGARTTAPLDPGSLRPQPVRLRRRVGRRRRGGDRGPGRGDRACGSRRGGCSSSSARPRTAPALRGAARRQADLRRRRRRGRPRRRRDDLRASASTGSSTCREAGDHTLELRFDAGIEGYAFTFG